MFDLTKPKRKFAVINGTKLSIHEFANSSKAKEYCENYLDHSKTVAYYEIKQVTDHTKIFENQD